MSDAQERPLSPDEEELFAQLLAGERTVDEPALEALMNDDPVLARRWAEYRELQDLLQDDASLERETLAIADEMDDVPGMDVAKQFLAAQRNSLGRSESGAGPSPALSESTPAPSIGARLLRSRVVWAIAASILVVALFRAQRTSTDSKTPLPVDSPVLLGPKRIQILAPNEGAFVGTFRARLEWNRETSVQFEIYDADNGIQVLLQSPILSQPNSQGEISWTPTPEQIRQLPDHVRWEMNVLEDRRLVDRERGTLDLR